MAFDVDSSTANKLKAELPGTQYQKSKKMARLNASIKILVLLGDTIFLLLGISVAAISCMIYSGKILALNFEAAKRVASLLAILSLAFVIFTLCGCCGVFNQTIRKGICSGRRILCIHQFLLLLMLITSVLQVEELQKIDLSIDMVINESETRFMSYDSFERRIDQYFNQVYYKTICTLTTNDQNELLIDWIDANCPVVGTMDKKICESSEEQIMKTCETSCRRVDSSLHSSCLKCPYNQCRIEVLDEVQKLIHSLLISLRLISIISAIMVTLTCLLICYNPRDDIEIELLKTGVMTEEDVDAIRKLKKSSGRNFTYDKGNAKYKHVNNINLDMLHQQKETKQQDKAHNMTQASRRTILRGHDRIHPM